MALNADYQRYNPFRRPDWRWESVLRMVDRHPNPGRCTRRDDSWVRRARNFMLKWRARDEHERQELFYENGGANAGLFYAYQLFERAQDRPEEAMVMQARLLTPMPFKEIADACDTLPQTVEWYEALFYNVRDRLQARDWVTTQVLVPAMMRNFGLSDNAHASSPDGDAHPPWSNQVIARPFLDASLKMFAYFGGPVLCEFMIHGFLAGKTCRSVEDIPRFLDEHWAVTIKARSAQAARTFSINKYNVMELFQTHARIMEIERSEGSATQQRTNIERHVSALLDEVPWGHGEAPAPTLEGTNVPRYDGMAAELRDDELIGLAAGEDVKGLSGLEQLNMPPPRPKEEASK